ncbi:Uncharacterised protein [Mycobacteroides abscessus subsp. abscessus]|nr:Uncharacterised protein [Mycobacteroides abscessus subsp. abscessus]
MITALGTPTLWWFAAAALIAGIIYWVAGRDWRFGLPIVAALAMYLPWFQYTERPLFRSTGPSTPTNCSPAGSGSCGCGSAAGSEPTG